MASSTINSLSLPKRGAFILFEGIDRCGKTTQCELLVKYLNSLTPEQTTEKSQISPTAEFIRFPNRKSTIGQLINQYLSTTEPTSINDHTIHLLFSANRWEENDSIYTKLRSGTTLVCDRYAYSGVAYTSAKGLDMEWCKSNDRGLPSPDCIIYLDMPIEEAAERGSYGEERYEKTEFQKIIREKFMILKKSDEESKKITWNVLDARKSIEELSKEIQQIANRVIAEVNDKEIEPLWK